MQFWCLLYFCYCVPSAICIQTTHSTVFIYIQVSILILFTMLFSWCLKTAHEKTSTSRDYRELITRLVQAETYSTLHPNSLSDKNKRFYTDTYNCKKTVHHHRSQLCSRSNKTKLVEFLLCQPLLKIVVSWQFCLIYGELAYPLSQKPLGFYLLNTTYFSMLNHENRLYLQSQHKNFSL